MPKGVDVISDGEFATIDFVDRSLRGVGLSKLLSVTPPELVEKLTREGPRAVYRVPEDFARQAGLLDDPQDDDGDEPNERWSRPKLNAYAQELGIDAKELPNKDAVLDAIEKKQAGQQPE